MELWNCGLILFKRLEQFTLPLLIIVKLEFLCSRVMEKSGLMQARISTTEIRERHMPMVWMTVATNHALHRYKMNTPLPVILITFSMSIT